MLALPKRTLAVLGALAMTFSTAAASSSQFLRRPDLHGDRVVFQSEGDLWLGSLSALTAARVTSDEGVEGPAFFSPDGKWIAFTAQYDGGTDAYVMDSQGGPPRRLTWDPTAATVLGWTPDGKEVLFRSRRGFPFRRNRLWEVPFEGGSAHLYPIPYVEFASMNADGRRLAYVPISAEWQNWKRYRGGEADDIWLANLSDHSFKRLTTDPGVDTEPQWIGETIYFVSERDGHANLWHCDASGGALEEATHYTDYDVRYPSTDGKRVIFEHGDGLALYDPASGTARDLNFDLHSERIHARPRVIPALPQLASVRFGPTGKRLLVSTRGQVLSAPVEHGEVRVIAAPAGARCQRPEWSPDGQRVAFVSDQSGEEQIWTAPAMGGEAKQLTRDLRGELGPLRWSPDGKTITTTDRETRVMLVDAESGAVTVADQADRAGSYDVVNEWFRFSPDGRWLAYAKTETNWNNAIWLYELSSHRKVRVSDPEMNCTAPAFDPDGKFLYFLADRAFNPRDVAASHYFAFDRTTRVTLVSLAADTKSPFLAKDDEETGGSDAKKESGGKHEKAGAKAEAGAAVTRVDADGLAARTDEVPVPADRYLKVVPVKDRLLLLVDAGEGGGEPGPSNQLRALDLKKKDVSVLVKKLDDFQVSRDGKKLLLESRKSFTVADADAKSIEEGKGKVETSAWTITVDPAAEWRQMFFETWRIARDFFYDPNMHGVDWNAVRAKYGSLLPAVADRSDLAFLQGQVVAELNCGHAYIRGGDAGGATPLPMGYLGADFEPVRGATPAYRITRLYAGDGFDLESRSPLLAPGLDVKVGDCILAVGGQPVRSDQDLQALLAGTADRVIALTVNRSPTMTGAREIRVKPLASELNARYQDWVASRTEYVHEHGGPNLGYLHIPDMSARGLREYAKHWFAQVNTDGMVVDVRFNGGGYIDAMLLLQMSGRPYSYFKPRYGASWTRQDWGYSGPLVSLCNENSGSDAEEFCDAFQRLKLGPVYGVRTWGGEVGSGAGYSLLDGGLVYIPNYGEWVPGGQWVIEGKGVEPDEVVPDDPTAVMQGRDPQLDRAIEYLKAELHGKSLERPQPPPFPNKVN
jgi:tricorn protease